MGFAVLVHLVVTSGPDAGKVFDLTPERKLTIGRGANSDTQINDPRMSRAHCELELVGNAITLRDLSSSSGTLVDGNTVSEKQIEIGQKIQAGDTEFELRQAIVKSNESTMVSGQGPGVDPSTLVNLVGTSINRYHLESVLAVAKSGIVFRAKDAEKERTVAFKVLTPSFTSSEEQRDRFVRAMKTMLPIRHPNIIRIYNAGKSGPYCWAAMEFIDGENLSSLIDKIGIAGMLDWKDVWRVAVNLSRALEHAHQHKIVHRNVTPTNILRRSSDKVCLLGDLVLAKALEGTFAQQVTQPGQLLGELPYQSPERTQVNTSVDERSDLYELGATLYALLTGKPPAEGASLAEIIKNIRGTVPKRPIEFQMSINQNFSDLVMRLLEKQAANRPEGASSVLSDLERIGRYNNLTA
jgi:serine/threonine protein kinase